MEHSIAHNNKIISLIERKINCLGKWGINSPYLINKVEKMQEVNEFYGTAILLFDKADEILTKVTLNDVNNTPVSCSKFKHIVDYKLAKAKKLLDLAMKCVQNGKYTDTISHFKCSWKYSQLAMKHVNNECHSYGYIHYCSK